MQFIYQKTRKYPLSALCIVAIWVLSLAPMPETHFDTIEFADKWVHFVMYGGTCSVIWIEYFRNHSVFSASKLFIFAWLLPVLMGGLLELLQAYCTTTRSGDWIDFLANSVGVTLAAIVMVPLAVWLKKQAK
ncbi:MAG: VanZ family protein [Prevotella sp.]|nr:VanZ family protein [Prevotella sp.]